MKSANTVFGRSSGKLAGVVASTWKGINVVREKPLTVNQPNTENQLNQRARMRMAVSMVKPNLSFAQQLFKGSAIKQSAYNVAVSEMLKGITASQGMANFTNPDGVLYSKGSLANVTNPSCTLTVGIPPVITWVNNANGANILATDLVGCVAVNPQTGAIEYASNTAIRSAQTYSPTFFNNVSNGGWDIYAFTSRPTEGKASDSIKAT